MSDETSPLDRTNACLFGARDDVTGQTYFPPRAFAADGSMRRTQPVSLSRTGILYSWTVLGDQHFGQVDLPEGVRVQCRLEPSDHAIDATYELVITGETDSDWRFRRA